MKLTLNNLIKVVVIASFVGLFAIGLSVGIKSDTVNDQSDPVDSVRVEMPEDTGSIYVDGDAKHTHN